jgi:putative transposase
MSSADPFWGAPRIHGELLKLGVDVTQATVGRYLPRRPKTLPDLAQLSAQPPD